MGKFTNLSKTLYSYFNGFESAYLEESVPTGTQFPYITYNISFDTEYTDNLIQARIWTKSTSLVQASEIADRIAEDIGNGRLINCVEGGKLWLKAGSPFQQFVAETDINFKTIYINIVMNYLK